LVLSHSHDELLEVIRTLNDRIWERRLTQAGVDRWLTNFDEEERLIALHLLAHFTYFGQREMRELLRALYRDLFRYHVVQAIRNQNGGSIDPDVIEPAFREQLARTRFLGVGNPSESGTHLLYYFRQENRLPRELFINTHEIFSRGGAPVRTRFLRHPDVLRYVFVDDLCGSGTQAKEYSSSIVEELLDLQPSAAVSYLALVGLDSGLEGVRADTRFTDVRALFVLDDSFRCFGEASRYFLPDEGLAKTAAEKTARRHGNRLCPQHPVGYKDGQLLLGFFHNVPDNVLPIIWSDDDGWCPIFKRYPKLEGA
jgi:hypothetical protein